MMAEITNKEIIKAAKCALARKDFYEFCKTLQPTLFKKERWHLKEWCISLQKFWETGEKTFWLLNGPPRHGKSLIGQLFCAWLYIQNPKIRILVLAYNAESSEIYGKKVRDYILQEKALTNDGITYRDIAPDIKIKRGDGASTKWRIDGSDEVSFLSASLSTSITGMGFDVCIIDDMIKNSEEAHNIKYLESCYTSFKDTVLSRMEGEGSKFLITMTRWATNDICGKMLQEDLFKDEIEQLTYPAKIDDKWIAPDMIPKGGKFLKTLSSDIFLANYMQTPIDITNKLYTDGFKTWNKEDLPNKDKQGRKIVFETEVMVDSADRGKDYLCALFYIYYKGKIFITDIIYTQKPIKETQQMILDGILKNNTASFICEGNAGGSIFTENIKKLYTDKKMNRCRFSFYQQNKNKESRIRAQAGWVQDNIYMPEFWDKDYQDFYRDITSFQAEFTANAHDDCADTLTAIADKYNGNLKKGLRIVR